MPNINITPPPPIVVQVKGGKTTAISSPTGSATRLVQLSDVRANTVSDGKVLTYVAANGDFEFVTQASASGTDQFARDQANSAFNKANTANVTGQAAFDKANGAIYTAAQIRANLSNTAPVNYDPSTGIISHALSGVAPTTYGNTAFVPSITVDNKGHISSAVNTAIALDAAAITSGTLVVGRGGTGQTTYSNGDLLIGNTISGGLDRANLTQGFGIIITNSNGKITLDAAVGKTYYLVLSQASDVASYNVASILPSANAEINTSSIYTGTAYSLASAFLMAPGEPGTVLLPAGTYGRHFHATTDGVNNEAQLRVDLYKYAANTLETLLRTNESPIFDSGDADALLLNWNVTDANNYDLVETDRLLFKVYARRVSGGSGSVRITVFYEGTQRASYIPTTILTSGADAFARTQANAAFNRANAAYANANTAIYTAAQIRANISNTFPVGYSSTTGVISLPSTANGQLHIGNTVSGTFDLNTIAQTAPVIVVNNKGSITLSHASSGVTAKTYGNATLIPVITVDAFGHITAVSNVAGSGGTGLPASSANGQTLIGNTVSGSFDVALLTPGTGIAITNDKGSITIAATGGSAIDQYARDKANGAAQNSFVTLNVAGQSDIVADSNTDILTIVGSGITITTNAGTDTLTIQHPASGVVASGYGDAATVPKFVVDANGHVTSVTNTAIAIAASQITSGTLVVARGGTGQSTYANGQILVGNGVSTGLDLTTIAQTAPVIVVNGKGTITLSHASSGVVAAVYGNASIVPSVTVDAFGHVTSATNTAIAIGAAAITSGATANGQTLIGNTVSGAFDVNLIAQTAPVIVVNGKGTITLSHATTAVGAGTYGGSNRVIGYTVDTFGHLTAATNVSIDLLDAGVITTGTLVVARGGTGQSSYTNGQILIGNTGSSGLDKATIAQSAPIIVTNLQGSITISHARSGVVALDSYGSQAIIPVLAVDANGHITAVVNTAIGGLSTGVLTTGILTVARGGTGKDATGIVNGSLLIGNTVNTGFDLTTIAQTAPVIVVNGKGTITLSHASSGVVATGYGTVNQIPVFVVDAFGHITSVTNTAIGTLDAGVITTGTLVVARGGTGQSTYTNGQILIGNTGSTGLDKALIAQSAPVIVTVAQGSITLSHARSGVTALDSYGSQAIIPVLAVDSNGHITAVVNTAIGGLGTGVLTTGILPVARGGTGKDATGLANGQILIGNTVNTGFDLTTIAQTAPVIVVNGKGTITLSHASSGVVATGYGTVNQIPVFVVDTFGHVTSVTNTAIGTLDAGVITTGTLVVARGGTGQSSYTNGQILIGNTGSTGLDKATIAQSAPIIVTNLQGSITISHARSGVVALDSYGSQAIIPVLAVDANGHITAVVNTAIGGLGTGVLTTGILPVARGGTGLDATGIVNGSIHVGNTVNVGFDTATIAQTTPVIVVNGKGTITLSHATTAVVAGTYGGANRVIGYTVDAFGHLTAASNVAIDQLPAAAITTGILAQGRGGTGFSGATANGQTLIGNTVSGGFDLATITAGTGVTVTNDKGSITIASTATGSGNSKQAEVDFGTTPVTEASFTITDANVTTSSVITGCVAYVAPTGKDLDELEFDQFDLKFAPGTGQMTLYMITDNGGLVAGKYKINYTIG